MWYGYLMMYGGSKLSFAQYVRADVVVAYRMVVISRRPFFAHENGELPHSDAQFYDRTFNVIS